MHEFERAPLGFPCRVAVDRVELCGAAGEFGVQFADLFPLGQVGVLGDDFHS